MEIKLNSNNLALSAIHQMSDIDVKLTKKNDSTLEESSNRANSGLTCCQKILQWIVDLFNCIFCGGCRREKTTENPNIKIKAQIADLMEIRNKNYHAATPNDAERYKKIMEELPDTAKVEITELAYQYYAFKEISGEKPFSYEEAAQKFNKYLSENAETIETCLGSNRSKYSYTVGQVFVKHSDSLHDIEAILSIYSARLATRITGEA